MNLAHHTRARATAAESQRAAHDPPVDLTFAAPPPYDRPVGALNQVFLSPVTISRRPNDQEMQSGADEMSGVHESDIAGGDYSREQGVGRSPGFEWPWNIHSAAFNTRSLDRWALERTGLGLANPHSGINPLVGVPETPYSPITAMDQMTTYYENDPDQWQYFPTPVVIPEAQSPSFTSQAVLG